MRNDGFAQGSPRRHPRPDLMLERDSDYVQNSLKMMAEKVAERPDPVVVDMNKRCLAFGLALHVCIDWTHVFSGSVNQTNQNKF